jgi:hypothetical protein
LAYNRYCSAALIKNNKKVKMIEQLKIQFPPDAESVRQQHIVMRRLVLFLKKWHDFQNKNKSAGNNYHWWHSRWCDDHPCYDLSKKWIVWGENWIEINYQLQKMFPKLWENYQTHFQRLGA